MFSRREMYNSEAIAAQGRAWIKKAAAENGHSMSLKLSTKLTPYIVGRNTEKNKRTLSRRAALRFPGHLQNALSKRPRRAPLATTGICRPHVKARESRAQARSALGGSKRTCPPRQGVYGGPDADVHVAGGICNLSELPAPTIPMCRETRGARWKQWKLYKYEKPARTVLAAMNIHTSSIAHYPKGTEKP